MTSPQAVIFDLDGTLIDSAPDIHAAANVMLAELGRAPLTLNEIVSFIGNGVEKLVERSLLATGGLPDGGSAAALEVFLTHYNANAAQLTRVYPGVMTCLARVQARGVPMAVCTNKLTGPARSICAQFGLTPFMKTIAGAEPSKPRKPDPQPLLRVAAFLGVGAGSCLYVGDSEIDFLTAKRANIPFMLFSGGYLKEPIRELPVSHLFADWAAVDLLQGPGKFSLPNEKTEYPPLMGGN